MNLDFWLTQISMIKTKSQLKQFKKNFRSCYESLPYAAEINEAMEKKKQMLEKEQK